MSRPRFRPGGDEIAGLVAIGAFGLGVLLLVLGIGWWWKALIVGWLVVLPIVGVVGEMFDGDEREATEATVDHGVEDDEDVALAALRESYATGEITEAEFERRVERLLETEDRETARERIGERAIE